MADAARSLKHALGQVHASPESESPALSPDNLALFCWHAPQPAPFGEGRQWFRDMGWTFNDPENIVKAAQKIEATLAHISQTHNIPRQNIALIGFSQGAMTSLYTLPQLSMAPAAVVALCGGMTTPPPNPQPTSGTHTPILFVHGLNDDVWPADVTVKAEEFFRRHNYPTQLELVEGLGHGIDGTVLAHVTVFLAHTFSQAS